MRRKPFRIAGNIAVAFARANSGAGSMGAAVSCVGAIGEASP